MPFSDDQPIVGGDEVHAVGGKESTTLEDEEEYSDFDVGDNVEQCTDAGAIHDNVHQDTEIDSTRGIGEGPEDNYGGENGEYDDIINPEDDDERCGDALPDELGGCQGSNAGSRCSVGVDATQAIFPGSDRW